jgi:CelD/BcsL family acetyltransferase involved in cellulose biosynthesis
MGLDFLPATEADREEIAEFVCSHPDGQIEHTWEGSLLLDIASNGRWRTRLLAARVEGKLTAVMPVSVAGKGFRVMRSDGGPLISSALSSSGFTGALHELIRISLADGCCRLEMRMLYPETIGQDTDGMASSRMHALESAQLRRLGAPHKGSYWVTIQEDGPLLESLSSKCRRDVRKGMREGVTVEMSRSPMALDYFYQCYRELCARKGLDYVSEAYIRHGVAPCMEAGLAAVFSSKLNGNVCNMALVSLTGRPSYWLGASTQEALSSKTPTGQALHFGVMQQLRAMGRTIYDLGGSPGPVPQQGHPNFGVWQFKYEFGGQYVTYLDRFERVLRPGMDRMLSLGLRFRDAVRSARRQPE